MILCGIDVETTGLNIETDSILEVGMALWDTDTNQPVKLYSEYVYDDRCNINISNENTDINGVTVDILQKYGIPRQLICEDINAFISCANYVVAHNGTKFDIPMLSKMFADNDKQLENKTLIDTYVDVDYPAHCTSRSLLYLQSFHGFVMPIKHRAVFDVITMFLILQRYDLCDTITSANSESIWVEALVDYEHRQDAKDAGFRWLKPDGFNREHWLKNVKTVRLHREKYDKFCIKAHNDGHKG